MLSDNLRNLRRSKGLSQDELAIKLKSSMSNLPNGTKSAVNFGGSLLRKFG